MGGLQSNSLAEWGRRPKTVVLFTHNAVCDLPGVMQETEISPLQSLTCQFVSQFVPAIQEVEKHKAFKSQ